MPGPAAPDDPRALLDAAAGAGVFPSAVALVASGEAPRWLHAAGQADPGTIFDVASLTKALATTTLAMLAVDEGALDLASPLGALLPELAADADPRKRALTARHLLCHASGLPAWAALAEAGRGAASAVAQAARAPLEAEPGARSVYSDLGFVLLGAALERALGAPLDALFAARVAAPLGLEARFVAHGRGERHPALARVAPTEITPARGPIRGEVHDENAHAMGGVAGHAGLFATADDVHRVAAALVARAHGRPSPLEVAPATVRAFFAPCGVAGSTWRLGWDGPSPHGSSAGELLSRRAVGHLGFTGCSVWIDPGGPLWIVLLSNRVCPSRADERIRALRPRFHDAVMASMGGAGAVV